MRGREVESMEKKTILTQRAWSMEKKTVLTQRAWSMEKKTMHKTFER